ncbi:hypothetical protein AMECASPLE_025380, partial [Ameca splendens]
MAANTKQTDWSNNDSGCSCHGNQQVLMLAGREGCRVDSSQDNTGRAVKTSLSLVINGQQKEWEAAAPVSHPQEQGCCLSGRRT